MNGRWIFTGASPDAVRRRLLMTTLTVFAVVAFAVAQRQLLRGQRADAYGGYGLAVLLFGLAITSWFMPRALRAIAWIASGALGATAVARTSLAVAASFYDGGLLGRLPQIDAFLPLVILLTFILLARPHAIALSSGIAVGVALPIGVYLGLSPNPAVMQTQLSLLDSYVIAPAASVLLAALYGELQVLFEEAVIAKQEAEAKADRDVLTGLLNRRGFEGAAKNGRDPYCIAVVDIDHFKRVNDENGHDAGDDVLRLVAETLSNGIRSSDLAGRWGGEEFIIRFGHCATIGRGLRAAEKVRTLIEAETPVTISVGVAVGSYADDDGLEGAFKRADAAVYAAKNAGRNRIAAWNEITADVDPQPEIPPPQTMDLSLSTDLNP